MRTLKINLILGTIILSGLSACNGGGSGGFKPEPTPSPTPTPILPNVFSAVSVKDLTVELFKESSNEQIIGALNRTKIGGHVYYRIKIGNPNNFAMKISHLAFTNQSSFLFTQESFDSQPDNCFNQSWYLQTSDGTNLDMPANASCAFYTTTPAVYGINPDGIDTKTLINETDYLNYTATANGFGFSAYGDVRDNAWCESGCFPLGRQQEWQVIGNSGTTKIKSAYYLWPISKSIFSTENYPTSSFVLSGEYVYDSYINLAQVLQQRYQIDGYNYQTNDLNYTQNGVDVIYSHSGLGLVGTTFSYNGLASATVVDGDSSSASGNSSILFPYNNPQDIAQNIETFTTGLDNFIYIMSLSKILYYFSYNTPDKPLNAMSATLPVNGIVYGADASSNLIINSAGQTKCYLKVGSTYSSGNIALSDLSDIQTQPISSNKFLYSRNSIINERFYDVNKNLLSNPFVYQVNALTCSTVPIYLATPRESDNIVITGKYTAVHVKDLSRRSGYAYFFAPPTETSLGENDDTGI